MLIRNTHYVLLDELEDAGATGGTGALPGTGSEASDTAKVVDGAVKTDASTPKDEAGAAAAAAAGTPGKAKSADQIKEGMAAAIGKVLDENAAEVKGAAKSKDQAGAAAAAAAAANAEAKITPADARKYLVSKGKASELAGKTEGQILDLYKAQKATDDKAAKKPTDEELFKVPEGMQKGAQNRFQALVTEVKTERAARVKAEQAAQESTGTVTSFREILKETNTSADDLSMLLEYNRLCKAGSAGDLEQALKIIDEQRTLIAQALGRPVDGVDVLAGFPDLQQQVKDLKITPEAAAEIAKGRRDQAAARQRAEAQGRERQSAAQRTQAREQALNDIAAFASKKAKEDIDYPRKEAELLKAIERISKNSPPHLWVSQLELLYDTITSVAPAQAAAAAARTEQPLRPNSGGGGTPAPKSMAAAIDAGLGYAP
jgi:hypothetical protein